MRYAPGPELGEVEAYRADEHLGRQPGRPKLVEADHGRPALPDHDEGPRAGLQHQPQGADAESRLMSDRQIRPTVG